VRGQCILVRMRAGHRTCANPERDNNCQCVGRAWLPSATRYATIKSC
jgi:hypothetical protein